VATAGRRPTAQTIDRYARLLMEALARKATPSKNANVLHHALGRFGRHLDADEKREILEFVEQYRHGKVPLIVPITRLNHYVRRYGLDCLREQTYLNAHPLELKLRWHA